MPKILNQEKTGFKFLPIGSTDAIKFYRKEINGEEYCELWITFVEPKRIHFEILYSGTTTIKRSPMGYIYSGDMDDTRVLEFFERYLEDSKK